MSGFEDWIICPKCGGIHLERVGAVGFRGVKDSRAVKCVDCNYQFRTKGQTWGEAHGGTP